MAARKRVVVAIVVVGAALALLIVGFRHYYLVWPTGKGPAGPPVPREPFAQVWTPRPVLLLGLGDSVTAGFGVARGYSYFGRLVENPPDEFADMRGISLSAVIPSLTTENRAVSGSTSIQHLATIEQLEKQPAGTLGLVVMTTGGNDLIHDYGRRPPREGAMFGATIEQARPWIANFAVRLDRMLDGLDERFPGGCQVFLADIYDPTDGIGAALPAGLPRWPDGLAIHAAYNATIHQAAADRQNVHLVPMHATFLGHGIYCRQFWRRHYRAEDPTYWYGHNFEDPNVRGYDAIRRVFLREMAEVLAPPTGAGY